MTDASTPAQPVLELRGVSKRFGRLWANRNIDFDVRPGEVHALCGENGAGKTTLMNVLYGLVEPTEGTILVDGTPVEIRRPRDAIELGIGMVHQHFMLIPVFTVTENVVLADEPSGNGLVNAAEAERRVRELSERYHLAVDPGALVQDISVGQQQRAEILKALYRDARILILDEPTAVLTPQEVDDLLRVIAELRDRGIAVILITHKLREVLAIADRISVLRRGELVGTVAREGQTEASIARMMVGRDVLLRTHKRAASPGEPVLRVRDLGVRDERGLEAVAGVSFDVRAGEVVAIAGVDGNGQEELVDAIAGLRQAERGSIHLGERDITADPPHEVSKAGLAHIPQDRHRRGIVLPLDLHDNVMMHDFDNPDLVRFGVIDRGAVAERTERLLEEYDVRADGGSAPAASLSGGNQQKLVVAREISRRPRLLLAAQPTRGVDIGAIEFIHQRIIDERDSGTAVLLVSLENHEILGLADRILVIFDGRIVAEFAGGEVDEHELGLAMLGQGAAAGARGGQRSTGKGPDT